jgi:hypothetical protein
LDERVRRRVRAGRLLLKGKTPAQAAKTVSVARQTVYTWKEVLDEGGIDALRAIALPGRPARLDETQLQALGQALLKSPTEYGLALSCGRSACWCAFRPSQTIRSGWRSCARSAWRNSTICSFLIEPWCSWNRTFVGAWAAH